MTVVAVAQLPLAIGDVTGNRAAAAEAVASAAARPTAAPSFTAFHPDRRRARHPH